MKQFVTILACAMALALSHTVRAAEAGGKEKEIKGEGCCMKCELKKADECQNAIKVKENGKEVLYILEPNKVSKDFHSKVCRGPHKVIAKGTVKKDGDKMILVASKIELAPEQK